MRHKWIVTRSESHVTECSRENSVIKVVSSVCYSGTGIATYQYNYKVLEMAVTHWVDRSILAQPSMRCTFSHTVPAPVYDLILGMLV